MGESGTRQTPFVLGLTGAIACGKTTVGDMVLELGALQRIDADRVVHELMTPGTETTRDVLRRFGADLAGPHGGIDRGKLADVVFIDPESLAALESIVHPAVRSRIRSRLAALSGTPGVVVLDAVKLLQSDLLEMCHAVWVVRCRRKIQMRRLTDIRHLTERAANDRLAAQPLFDHPAVSRVIDNSGSIEDLRLQTERAWDELPAQARRGR